MLSDQEYARASLELHLYFARSMKEHAVFMALALNGYNRLFRDTAESYKTRFDHILSEAFSMATGVVSRAATESDAFVTAHTAAAEAKTQRLTGIQINTELTRRAGLLYGGSHFNVPPSFLYHIVALNQNAMTQVNGLIQFKRQTLDELLAGRLAAAGYPSHVAHMLREARAYRKALFDVQRKETNNEMRKESRKESKKESPAPTAETAFYNGLAREHAQFIRGLLDPAEDALCQKAQAFADAYGTAGTDARQTADDFAAFAQTVAEGVAAGRLKSAMQPLIADHMLREANYAKNQ